MRDARLGKAFGELALEYDRVRPGWPEKAIERVRASLGISSDVPVADLAAGTGKLTRLLLERFEEVWALEPDERMRAVLATSLPSARVMAGSAEAIPLEDASLAAIFVGDAFHWFHPEAAVSEISRVLRPGGGVVVLWNDWWEVEPPVSEAAAALLEEPFVRSGRAAAPVRERSWRDVFAAAPFTPLEEDRVEWETAFSAGDLLALYMTTSSLASLPTPERIELRTRLAKLLSGEYRLPITTRLYWARRTDER